MNQRIPDIESWKSDKAGLDVLLLLVKTQATTQRRLSTARATRYLKAWTQRQLPAIRYGRPSSARL